MIRFVRRAYQAAFSRGHGYEPHVRGPHLDGADATGYYIDYRPKVESRRRYPDHPLQPADVAQLALGWHECLLDGDAEAGTELLALCRQLEEAAAPIDGGLTWPYETPVPKYHLPLPWYSAMAQAQAASAFVRAWRLTGDDHHADCASRAVAPLFHGFGGLVSRTPRGPVLEECGPGEPAAHILNGWIFAIWGLRDVSSALGDTNAERLATATTECLIATLPQYDTGWWTRYSLYPHVLTDLAKPFYHRLHCLQVEILYDLTGEPELGRAAKTWREYDTPFAAGRAVASKLPFAATKQRRVPRRSGE